MTLTQVLYKPIVTLLERKFDFLPSPSLSLTECTYSSSHPLDTDEQLFTEQLLPGNWYYQWREQLLPEQLITR